MTLSIINALVRGVFAMSEAHANVYMPAVISLLEGRPVGNVPGMNEEGVILPFAIDPSTGREFSPYGRTAEGNVVFRGFGDAPKGSVAVISITGAITKYDYCGAYGTKSLSMMLGSALASSNVDGVVLNMDTPGGEVYGTKNMADLVAQANKPVVAHVDDAYCASAGYYIASQADHIMVRQLTDQVGSIGVYTTLVNFDGYYEAKGIKVIEVYSPTSPDKNKAYRDAVKEGKTKGIEEQLAHLDAVFMDTVKAKRPGVTKKALDGGMFYAEDAIANGLIDSMGTFADAVAMVKDLSTPKIRIR